MKLQAYRLQNYRRLRDVVIELDDEISIFVGANNSGKTSAVQGLHSMLRGDAATFELFDFSAILWSTIDEIGNVPAGDEDTPNKLPAITLDLWFRVEDADLGIAMPLLPSTDWEGTGTEFHVSGGRSICVVFGLRGLGDLCQAHTELPVLQQRLAKTCGSA